MLLVSEHIVAGAERLRAGPHSERARQDAEMLLRHLLHWDLAYLLAHSQEVMSAEDALRYCVLIDRRLTGEPIQYITGETEFYGLPFRVRRNVLIPRPETEQLAEKVIELAARWGKPRISGTRIARPRIVDVGTGSGAIALALAVKLPGAAITATDISAAALDLARENAQQNGVAERLRFVEGDLLAPVAQEKFDVVVSNPPYVPESDRATLAVEVREFEPAMALFAGDDGLAVYRRLIPAAHAALAEGGWIALEIGYGQADAVGALLAEAGFEEIGFTADLQGIERVAVARRA
jgi:release factor glutamine methyltransferase